MSQCEALRPDFDVLAGAVSDANLYNVAGDSVRSRPSQLTPYRFHQGTDVISTWHLRIRCFLSIKTGFLFCLSNYIYSTERDECPVTSPAVLLYNSAILVRGNTFDLLSHVVQVGALC